MNPENGRTWPALACSIKLRDGRKCKLPDRTLKDHSLLSMSYSTEMSRFLHPVLNVRKTSRLCLFSVM